MKKSLPLLLSLLLSPAALHAAVSVTTTPSGYQTLTLPATGTTTPTSTYLALPLLNSPVWSGPVGSLNATTLNIAGTPWVAKAFVAVGHPHFVKITSGKQAGRFLKITANTNHTATVDITDQSAQSTGLNATGFAMVAKDTFEVIEGDTLASFLGDGTTANPILLKGGTSAAVSDTVSIFQPKLGTSLIYYFNTTRKTWVLSTSVVNQNNVVIYPETVLGITRGPGSAKISLVVQGEVPKISPLTKTVGAGKPIQGFTRLPIDVHLSGLTFSGWAQSTSVATADTIGLWNPTLKAWQIYYQLPNVGTVKGQWRLSGNATTNQSSVLLPAGTGLQITKHASVSGAKSFLAEPLPYTP